MEFKQDQVLHPGATLKTLRTFASVHQGDYFQALRDYRGVMVAQGVHFEAAPESAFGPIWCAWGYGRKIQPSQIYKALPIVKKLGFTWVTLDDGWQTAQGDWFLLPPKFPNGDADMRALVDKIHAEGFGPSCGGRRWPPTRARSWSRNIPKCCCSMRMAPSRRSPTGTPGISARRIPRWLSITRRSCGR